MERLKSVFYFIIDIDTRHTGTQKQTEEKKLFDSNVKRRIFVVSVQ
jgi:hypothetical protein